MNLTAILSLFLVRKRRRRAKNVFSDTGRYRGHGACPPKRPAKFHDKLANSTGCDNTKDVQLQRAKPRDPLSRGFAPGHAGTDPPL